MPLILQTLAACAHPLVNPTGLDSVAKVKGAPILSENDMAFARLARMCSKESAWVVGSWRAKCRVLRCLGKKFEVSGKVELSVCG